MSKIYGLHKRGKSDIWTPNYTIPETGIRLRSSTGETKLHRAVKWCENKIQQKRDEIVFGIRPQFTFEQAAKKYLKEYTGATLADVTHSIYMLSEYLGDVLLTDIYLNKYEGEIADGHPKLVEYINDRFSPAEKNIESVKLPDGSIYLPVIGKDAVKKKTLNNTLGTLRHILKLAEKEWRHENMLWIEKANLIRLVNVDDATPSKIISWVDQRKLMDSLPKLQADMIQFKVNTGCRDTEVCNLRWDWLHPVVGVDRPVFLIPPIDEDGKRIVKNKKFRLVVLNDLALSVIEKQRGNHDVFVFAQNNGKPLAGLLTSSFKTARKKLNLKGLTIHGLKRTYGTRLRNADVPLDDRVELLGHTRQSVTQDYDTAGIDDLYPTSIKRLIDLSNKVVPDELRLPAKPALSIVKSDT